MTFKILALIIKSKKQRLWYNLNVLNVVKKQPKTALAKHILIAHKNAEKNIIFLIRRSALSLLKWEAKWKKKKLHLQIFHLHRTVRMPHRLSANRIHLTIHICLIKWIIHCRIFKKITLQFNKIFYNNSSKTGKLNKLTSFRIFTINKCNLELNRIKRMMEKEWLKK